MFSYYIFSAIQYDMWYQFEMDEAFLPIYVYNKNVDLLKPEYFNQQSIYRNKSYHMHWVHKDVSTKKIL